MTMIADISQNHPRTDHMRLVAAINNVGMCAHLLKHISAVMEKSVPVLREYQKATAPATADGITLDAFAGNAQRMAEELSMAELYSPDCGEALAAMTRLLPTTEQCVGG